jgi:uncharacterized protein (TIGR02996 family)
MTERDFLAGIAAHPAELDRWLVLADWLEDQGDPRAELARLRYLLHTEPDHLERAQRHARQLALLESGLAPVVPTWTNSLGMELALILPGSFWMGSPDAEQWRSNDEQRHRVNLTQPFFLGVYPVTVGEFGRFVAATNYNAGSEWRHPGFAQTDRHPVVNVSWNDAQALVAWLNQVEGNSGLVYALPTEAQWEYACRAGSETDYWWGNDENKLGEYAWFDGNSGNATHPVDTKQPNSWGLWQMQGNIWEWCADLYGDYPTGEVTDPSGASGGSRRVFRGGAWSNDPARCRSAYRGYSDPGNRFTYIGFRLAVSVRAS